METSGNSGIFHGFCHCPKIQTTPPDNACHKASAGTGASTHTGCLLTGWTNSTRRAINEMLPSGLLRRAPYFRSPLMGHPMAANWQRI